MTAVVEKRKRQRKRAFFGHRKVDLSAELTGGEKTSVFADPAFSLPPPRRGTSLVRGRYSRLPPFS